MNPYSDSSCIDDEWNDVDYDYEFVAKCDDYEEKFKQLLSTNLDDKLTRSRSQDPRGSKWQ